MELSADTVASSIPMVLTIEKTYMKRLPGFPWHTTYPFQAIPRQRLFCPRPTKTRIIMEMDRQMEESICTLPTMQNQAVFICYPMNRDRLPEQP